MCLQLDIRLPSLPLITTPSPPRVMEPVLMRALQLLQQLQLLLNLTAHSQGTLPSLLTLAMANKLLPLPHRGMCTLNLEKILVTKMPITLVTCCFFCFFLLCLHQLQC